MKICSKCKVEKDRVEFSRCRSNPDGLQKRCKTCHEAYQQTIGPDGLTLRKRYHSAIGEDGLNYHQRLNYKNRYNLTAAEYDRMLREQQGVCAICGNPPIDRRLSVDHCHKTGKVRGLLCRSCNTGIGGLRESGEFLIKAAVYLGYSYGAGVLSANTLRRLKPVEPFIERTVIGGMSAGLSVAGYDVRIRENLKLPPDAFSLASTVEKFDLPKNVMAWMKDKSSWARQGLSVFNTCLEPGWGGTLTLELKNLGQESLTIASGSPIAQAVFAFTDEPTEGYSGKYNNQEASPQKFRPEQTP